MKSVASIGFVFCTAVAVALVAAGSAAASVGVNCVKPFDFTTKYQDLHNCKMNGVTITGSNLPGDAMQGSNLTGASLNGATIGTDSATLTLRDANLTNASLVGVTIGGDCTFCSATLTGATLKKSVIGGGRCVQCRRPDRREPEEDPDPHQFLQSGV